MSAHKNDGTIPYGTKVLTLEATVGAGSPVTYVAENIQVQDPSGLILRKNEIGEPNGQVAYSNDVVSFTCVLQLATTSTAVPPKGYETSVALFPGIAASTYFVHERGMTFEQEGDTKVPVTFRKKIN